MDALSEDVGFDDYWAEEICESVFHLPFEFFLYLSFNDVLFFLFTLLLFLLVLISYNSFIIRRDASPSFLLMM